MKNIDKILIPSGPTDRIDIQRAEGLINLFGKDSKYVILGVGPNIYEALEHSKNGKHIPKDLDHHLSLHNFVVDKIGENNVELITKSTTAVQNLFEFFKNERKGGYIIGSDSWQLSKYKRIFNVLQKKNKISKEVTLGYAPLQTDKYYNFIQKIASRIKTEKELMKI